MEIKQITTPVYTVGGKEFLTLKEAQDYITSLEERLEYTYYTVVCKPDLTEGRGYYDSIIVGVKKGYTKNALIQYLYTTFGSPIGKVMGLAPMDNWVYDKGQVFGTLEELNTFLNKEVNVGVGYSRKAKVLDVFYIDEAGELINTEK